MLKKLEIFPIETEGDICVNILCVQKVITSANNLLSLCEQKKKKESESLREGLFLPKKQLMFKLASRHVIYSVFLALGYNHYVFVALICIHKVSFISVP